MKTYQQGDVITVNTNTAPTKTGIYYLKTKIKSIKGNNIITEDCEPYFGYNSFSISDIVKTAFLISPVKNLKEEEKKEIEAILKTTEYQIYVPYKDTEQKTTEENICKQNRNAIQKADIVLIYYKEDSKGSIFDLGMAFALNKTIVCVNDVNSTEYKSFNNLLLQIGK